MSVFLYYHSSEQAGDAKIKQVLFDYVKQNQIELGAVFEETVSLRHHWTKRVVSDLMRSLDGLLGKKQTLIVYDALELAASMNQVLELLVAAVGKDLDVHFVKHRVTFHSSQKNKLVELIELMKLIDSDFSDVDVAAFRERKALGMPLGRPKGSRNKKLKLDQHSEEIEKYLTLGISKASIAKLVGCHPQTLYDWLSRRERHGEAVHSGDLGVSSETLQTAIEEEA